MSDAETMHRLMMSDGQGTSSISGLLGYFELKSNSGTAMISAELL